MNLLQLDPFLTHLDAPLVALDAAGNVMMANAEGRQLFDDLAFDFLPPGISRDLQGFLSWAFANPSTQLLPLTDGILSVTPLSAGSIPEGGIVLKWLPAGMGTPLLVFQEVSRAVNSSLILEDIFQALGDVLHQHIPYDEAVIVILDDTQNGIKILVRMFDDGTLEITGENNLFAGYDAVVDNVLKQPQPREYSTADMPDSVVFSQGTASAIVVPLVNKGVVIGLIAMTKSQAGLFQHHHHEMLVQVSEQLAIAVENAKFYWRTQAQAGREFLINQLTKAIRQSLDLDEILKTAVDELGRVTGVSRCMIQYFPEKPRSNEGPRFFEYCMPGIPASTKAGFELNVFRLRQEQSQALNPFVLNDIRDCPENLATPDFFKQDGTRSMAVFPIILAEKLVGTITLQQCDGFRVWVMEDIELMIAIAEHLGLALHQAKLFNELEEQKSALENLLEELQQAQMHLIQSEKMAVLGQFVAGIAHEVNTPLGTMTSNNSTLKSCVEKFKKGEHEDPAKLIGTMESLLNLNKMASDRIQEIVRNLRNFARLDESEIKVVDLHENMDSTMLLIQSSLHHKISVEKKYFADLPRVECFPGLLNQVFMNLIVNANHAISEKLENQPDATALITLETRMSADNKHVQVLVHDTGRGIPGENLTKIFDPGFTTKGVGVGTGLGLALCFKIVEKHKGRIDAISKDGHGTTFTVEIPVKYI